MYSKLNVRKGASVVKKYWGWGVKSVMLSLGEVKLGEKRGKCEEN